MVNIAILGHGIVGSGVFELIEKNQKQVAGNANNEIYVKRILDLRTFDVPYADRFTKDFDDILLDESISVVAEVMGGVHPAYEFTKAALQRGKSVVTSNKELVAMKGAELLKIAKQHGVNYYFEASVGGGIPVIHPLHHCLAANRITEIAGILNGTTNYILSQMIHEKTPFDEALKTAQELGYAERDPRADVEGDDACRKICILASLAFGKQVYPAHVYTEGITSVALSDVAYAKSCGHVIKLIGHVKQLEDGMLQCMVTPALLPKTSPLAVIEDVFNGILVRGDASGDVLFYGRGAGKMPTASAVVADIIDVAAKTDTNHAVSWVDNGKNYVVDYLTQSGSFYVRLESIHETVVTETFGEVTFLQRPEQSTAEVAFLVKDVVEGNLRERLQALSTQGVTVGNIIRVLTY